MNVNQLLDSATLQQEARFLRTIGKRQRAQAGNPALNAAYSSRDGATGQLVARTADGGTVRAAYISNQSVEVGRVLPSFVRGGTGFADIKPV